MTKKQKATKIWKEANRERCREHHRKWFRKNREKMREARRAWYHANKKAINLQNRARHAIGQAIHCGKIVRPMYCQECGAPNPESHHHNGYDEVHKLDVVWLCKLCHAAADKSIRDRQMQEANNFR